MGVEIFSNKHNLDTKTQEGQHEKEKLQPDLNLGDALGVNGKSQTQCYQAEFINV